jgi:hypothetical protein
MFSIILFAKTKNNMLAKLRITATFVQVEFSGLVFRQSAGISQGSILSALLCWSASHLFCFAAQVFVL